MPYEVVIADDPACAVRRLRLWRDAVGDHMADVDLSPAGDLPASMTLRGSLHLRAGRGAGVALIRAGGQVLRRTQARVRRSDCETVFANVVTSGSCCIDQHDRRDRVAAGGLCLYDTAAPYVVETSLDFSSVLLVLPRARLEARLGDLRSRTGALPAGPATGLVGSYWLGLANALGAMEPDCAEDMIEAGIEALAGAVQAATQVPHSMAGSEVLRRAHLAIRRRHAEVGLSGRDIAAHAGVSLRRLQELLQHRGETVGGAIRRARLDAAKRLLDDPRLDILPIKTLMARAGFRDAAHFSRAFSAAFGQSPAVARSARADRR